MDADDPRAAAARARGGLQAGPEPLGIDDRGREVISLLPGRAAVYPLDAAVLSDATLATVARTLRACHDATASFAAPPDAVWRWPAHAPVEVICHNDFAPYRFVPLTDPGNPDVPYPGVAEQRRRLAGLCAAYGGDGPDPAAMAAATLAKVRELVSFIVDSAAAADPAQQAVLERGDVAIYERDIAYLERTDLLRESPAP